MRTWRFARFLIAGLRNHGSHKETLQSRRLLVGSTMTIGAMAAGVGATGTVLCEGPGLGSLNLEPQGTLVSHEDLDLDNLLKLLQEDSPELIPMRTELPAKLRLALENCMTESKSQSRKLKILEVIERLSDKQSAALKFLGDANIVGLLKDQLKQMGWEPDYESTKGFRGFMGSIFSSSGTKKTVTGEMTPTFDKITVLCTKILSNLAKHSRQYDPLLKDEIWEILVGILKRTQNMDTKRNVLLCYACFASDENSAVQEAVMRELGEHLKDEDDVVQWYASGGIRNLCKHAKTHKEIVRSGLIVPLVDVLQNHKNPRAQALAASALADLATSPYQRAEVIRLRMVDAKVFEALGKVLLSTNDAVQRSVCRAIDQILGSIPPATDDRGTPKIYDQFKDTKVPQTLTRLSTKRAPPVVAAATSALYSVAGIDGMSDLALEVGAARIIIGACNSLDPGISGRALDALACMSESYTRQEYLVQASVLKVILALRSTNPLITIPLTTTVANLTRREELRAEVAHEGGLALLNAMLASGNIDKDTKYQALRALYNLSVSGLSRVMVVQYGSLSPIVNLLKSREIKLRTLAVKTLSNLMESLEYTLKAFESGALAALIECAKDKGELGCRAVLCVGEFTNLQELHREIVRLGGVEMFAEVIKSGRSSEAMGYAVLGLCNLAATNEARERIRESGAIGFLNSIAHASTFSPEMAAVAQAGLANLLKGEQTMTQVLPATPSTPI